MYVCVYIYELRGNRRDRRTEMRSDRRGRNTLSHRFPPRFFLPSPGGTFRSSTSEQSGQSRPLWGLNFGRRGGPCTSCRWSACSAPAGRGGAGLSAAARTHSVEELRSSLSNYNRVLLDDHCATAGTSGPPVPQVWEDSRTIAAAPSHQEGGAVEIAGH